MFFGNASALGRSLQPADDYERNSQLGLALRDALMAQDRVTLERLLEPDVVWDLAGDNAVSGQVEGIDGILGRLARLGGYGVNIKIEQITVNATGIALILHNTGARDEIELDEWLVTTVALRAGRVSRFETYLSDIPMMNAFFV